tara:strand:+ start:224 stop:1474 length:1251 start_codon:yes stop_codon:yes gene_type:complete
MNNRKISSYIYFLKDKQQRDLIIDSFDYQPSFGEISNSLSEKWKAMIPEDKIKYQTLSDNSKPINDIKLKVKTPYTIYAMDKNVKDSIKSELLKSENKTFSQLLAEKWRNLDSEVKHEYESLSVKYNEKRNITRKKPRTAYVFFISDKKVRESIKESENTNDFSVISKKLSEKWKNMDEIDKTPYLKLSNEDSYITAECFTTRKRARTAYTFYMMETEETDNLKKQNNSLSTVELLKLKSDNWHKLTEIQKDKYTQLNKKEKENLSIELKLAKPKQTRCKSAYTLYSSDKTVRDTIKQNNTGCSFGDMSFFISEQWRNLPSNERQYYLDKSEEGKVSSIKLKPSPIKTRAKSPYLQYSTDPIIRGKAKQIDQSLSVIELAKILGEQWMKLPEKEKDYYRNCYFCEREEVESKLGKG